MFGVWFTFTYEMQLKSFGVLKICTDEIIVILVDTYMNNCLYSFPLDPKTTQERDKNRQIWTKTDKDMLLYFVEGATSQQIFFYVLYFRT